MANIKTGGFLKGKKTYVAAVVTIVSALGAYLVGEMDFTETFLAVTNALFAAFIRHSVASSKNSQGTDPDLTE